MRVGQQLANEVIEINMELEALRALQLVDS